MRLLSIAKVLVKLGLPNLLRIARYRVELNFGRYRIDPSVVAGPFFSSLNKDQGAVKEPFQQTLFGWHKISSEGCPDWHTGYILGVRDAAVDEPWDLALSKFPPGADIKDVWELSRFYWVPELAQQGATGNSQALHKLNALIADWSKHNPLGQGVNWGCAQEASIRLLMLARAALILDSVAHPKKGLVLLLEQHARRIFPTLHYAIAQDNNHATSEAAALLVYGTWMETIGCDTTFAKRCRRRGRYWMQNRANVLIQQDGSSNQHSTNYHRVVLDTYVFCSVWCQHLGLRGFTNPTVTRLAKGAHWLRQMTDASSGDVVNLGANDGSPGLLDLSGTRRDFRATVQAAEALYAKQLAYGEITNAFDTIVKDLGIYVPQNRAPVLQSETFDAGGYHILRHENIAVYLSYPRFKSRPAQADALHCDIWAHGKNICTDTGTFSYSTPAPSGTAYGATKNHNTVEFDGEDQMPRLSRFLYGDWLNGKQVLEAKSTDSALNGISAGAAYKARAGRFHSRKLTLKNRRLIVSDQIEGVKSHAVLRWHLGPGNWVLDEGCVSSPDAKLIVTADTPILRYELTRSYRSYYYLHETPMLTLEVEVGASCVIKTEVELA